MKKELSSKTNLFFIAYYFSIGNYSSLRNIQALQSVNIFMWTVPEGGYLGTSVEDKIARKDMLKANRQGWKSSH